MIGVAVKPGATTLTRMLRAAHSIAAPLASMIRPPFAAEYSTSSDLPTMPSRELTHTNEPPAAGISDAKCFITTNALSRLVSSTFFASSYAISMSGLLTCRPWLRTTTSTEPKVSAACLARLATNASSLRSPGTYRSSGRAVSIRSLRPVSSSRAPSRRKWDVTACPIPLLAPVTSAVSLSSLISASPEGGWCRAVRGQSAEEATGGDRPPLQHRALGVGHDQLLEAVHDGADVVGHHREDRADSGARRAGGHGKEAVVLVEPRQDRLLPGDA